MVRSVPSGELERWFEQLKHRLRDAGIRQWVPVRGRSWMPVDVVDHGDVLVVTADVPGFRGDDLDVQVLGDSLYVAVSREEPTESGDGRYLRRERRHRSFSRTIDLPEPVDDEAASASLADGVLTVRLPTADLEAVAHSVPVS